MGNKDKKKSRHRSRSRSRDRDGSSHKEKKDRKRAYSSESSDDSSDSSSSDRRHKKHKSRARSRSPHQSGERSRSRSKKKKKKVKSKEQQPKEKRQLTPAEMEKLKEERQKQKELLKALETPEEKRARRMAKKEAKERKRKEEMGWDEEYMGYTNSDNPFGDEHLLDSFVWGKKLEKEGKKNMSKNEMMIHQKQKMIETKVELEKVKKRRIEREREMEEREREREREQREKEIEYFREWEMQEDTFHLNQAKLRSKIRIEDGRAKPIDLLAKYISMEDDDFSVEMHEPYTYLNGLTIQDLEDLLEDIKVYVELEQGKNVDYWRDITIISEDELNKLRKIDPDNSNFIGERRSGINQSVMEDVSSVFKGKTLTQLQLLEIQINNKLKGGEGVDVGYWESLLQQLGAHMARQRLRERHQEQLRSKLFKLKKQQGIESAPLFPIIKTEDSDSDGSDEGAAAAEEEPSPATAEPVVIKEEAVSGSESPQVSGNLYVPERPKQLLSPPREDNPEPSTSEEKNDNEDEVVLTEESLLEQRYEEYDAGNYSPRFLRVSEMEADTIVYEPEDDMKRLEYARRHALSTGRAKDDVEEMFEKKAREGMDSDEAQFSVEVPLEKQTLLWSDKYRPRKPRFFNRVHTGFEWNKYNQTHYDIDNPPPKIVQGYKFNIFYPDLIDKAKTPEYTLTPCEDNKDFAVLRFHAGPPYEDIGFKIVNREWEFSYKRGFRCQFHNNIFQLWFHFKRYRYRR